jgi:hypothetical protein
MSKPNSAKSKTDPFGWITAFLFPKSKKAEGSNTPDPSPAPKRTLNFDREKIIRAVWTTGSVLSLVINVVLLIVILILARQVFTLKRIVGKELLGGLYENFILMDQATIEATVPVNDMIPIDFDLTIEEETVVELIEPTNIYGAYVSVLSEPANITLPKGTKLPVKLNLTVPVKAEIPVTLNVQVNIPLEKTELHDPFVGLQRVVSPYYWLLQPDIETYEDVPMCKYMMPVCAVLFAK